MMTNRSSGRGPSVRTPVLLKITGTQTDAPATEPVVLVVRGEYFQKKETHYIFYTEYGDTGEEIRNRLTLRPGQVELKKSGPGMSLLVFEVGKRMDCHYDTVAGQMNLVSDTRRIHWEEASGQRKLHMEYSLLMNGQVMSDYQLTVEMVLTQRRE